jgi:hypothetical protein
MAQLELRRQLAEVARLAEARKYCTECGNRLAGAG